MHRNVPTLIIDPTTLFREGLRRLLVEASFQPVWCSDLPPTCPISTLAIQVSPLLIVGSEFEEALLQIDAVRRIYPNLRAVLIVDMLTSSQHQLITKFPKFGNAVVLRQSSCEVFVNTLKLVLDGSAVVPSEMLSSLLEARPKAMAMSKQAAGEITHLGSAAYGVPEEFGLSMRELSVLWRLRDGLANKEIARLLNITEATVKVHVKAILRKARIRNRTQAAMWASTFDGMAQLRHSGEQTP